MPRILITSLDHLKREASRDGGLNGFLALGSEDATDKLFSHNPDNDSWAILHESEDREALYPTTEAMLAAETAIAKALEAEQVWAYWIDEDAPLHEAHEAPAGS